jgi:tetratricopeptide (TPR) repeat protein
LDRARSELAANPERAITDSQRVLRIDDDDLDAYYVEAAGQARFDLAAQARSTLLRAADQTPQSFVTWTLLGDLQARAGNVSAARRYYRRALDLDPRDPGLAILARHPRSGLRAGS